VGHGRVVEVVRRLQRGDDRRIGGDSLVVGVVAIPLQRHRRLGQGYLAGEFRPLGKEQVGNGVPRVLNARCGAGCLARRLERPLDAARGVVGGVIRPEHLSEARRQVVLVEVAVLGVEVRRQHELDDVERRVTHPREVAAGRG